MSQEAPNPSRPAASSKSRSGLGGLIEACICAVLGAGYVILAVNLPVSILTGAASDDAWFVRGAISLVSGEWLGPFDQTTLIKGPGYSLFLALNHFTGLPISASQALLYFVACLSVFYLVRSLGVGRVLGLLLFALILFQPASFPFRVIRDNIYVSLLLLAFVGWVRVVAVGNINLFGAACFGLCAGLLLITREEGLWIAPAFALLAAYGLWLNWSSRAKLRFFAKGIATFIVAAGLPALAAASLNQRAYGTFQVVDLKNAAFVRAFDALNGVRIGPEIPHLSVPEAKREAIYRVSPAFRELEPYFKGEGKRWSKFGCDVYRNTCNDYATGWFIWALREGVAGLGYYSTAKTASSYYSRMADEIDHACAQGQLTCEKSWLALMPPVSGDVMAALPDAAKAAISLSLFSSGVDLTVGPSWPPEARLMEIVSFLGHPNFVPLATSSRIEISGWYYGPQENWLSVKCASGSGSVTIPVDRLDSPDIRAHFHDESAGRRRFQIKTEAYERCSLELPASENLNLPLAAIANALPRGMKLQNGILHVDIAAAHGGAKDFQRWIGMKAALSNLYRSFSPYLWSVGLASTGLALLASIAAGQTPLPVTAISLALWALYFSRIAILSVIDVTSFPAINIIYCMPIFPVWIAASILGVISLAKEAISWKSRRAERLLASRT